MTDDPEQTGTNSSNGTDRSNGDESGDVSGLENEMGNGDGTDHHRMMMRDFRRRFIVATILTVPVLVLSPTIQNWTGVSLQFSYAPYILFGFATAIFVYDGWPFLKGLLESDPRDVTALIEFAQETHRKTVQNLFWATGYNVIAIPLAAGILWFAGVIISPAVGAALMSASTVIVAVNAKLLSFTERAERDKNSTMTVRTPEASR